jgi:hypothetical protein
MNEKDDLRVLIPHWVEHNDERVRIFHDGLPSLEKSLRLF